MGQRGENQVNLLRDLQARMAARILTDEWMVAEPAVQILAEDLGDMESEIKRRINTHGILVIITTARFVRTSEEIPGELTITVLVGIGEHTRINRGPTGTQKPADDVAVRITALLDGYRPPGGWTPLSIVDGAPVDGPEELLTWQLRFSTQIRVYAAIAEVAEEEES
jgi:hypothetical protein